MKLNIFLIVMAYCVVSYAEEEVFIERSVNQANVAVELCLNEYLGLVGKETLNNMIDRAYVHKSANVFNILFSQEEVGTFGERSKSYRAYFSCGVLFADDIEVYFLGEPLKKPLVELKKAGSLEKKFYDAEVLEMLYKRDDDVFRFVKSQIYREPKPRLQSCCDEDKVLD